MYFRLAGGYIGISPLAPPDYARWPIMAALYDVAGVPDAGEQLKALLAHERVTAIIVSPLKYRFVQRFGGKWTSATWLHDSLTEPECAALRDLLSTLGVQPLEVGGVTLYRIPPERLAPYLHVTALEMQQRYARARFEVLLGAAQNYLAGGGDLATLDSHKQQVVSAGTRWFGGSGFPTLNPNKMFLVQWALGQWHPGLVAIGVEGSYEALQPLIAQYGSDSTAVYFPFPRKLAATAARKALRKVRSRPDGDGVHPRRTRERRGARCTARRSALSSAHGRPRRHRLYRLQKSLRLSRQGPGLGVGARLRRAPGMVALYARHSGISRHGRGPQRPSVAPRAL